MDTFNVENDTYILQAVPEEGIEVAGVFVGEGRSNNSTPGVYQVHSELEPPFDFILMWIIAVAVVALSLTTILGNLSVIVVYSMKKELQKFSNNFIISLAVADLFIGCLMPVNLVVTLSGHWPYHIDSCEVYVTIQAALCYVSFISILLVSIERWWCIHWPLIYRVKQSRRKAVLVIILTWTVTFLMFGPTNLVYRKLTGFQYEVLTTRLMCEAHLNETLLQSTVMAAVGFGLPWLLLITCNSTIYFKISRRKDNTIRRSITSETLSFISRKSSSESSTVDDQATELLKDPNENDKVPELTSIKIEKGKAVLPGVRPVVGRRFSIATTGSVTEPGTPKAKCSQLMRRVSFDMSILQDSRRSNSIASSGRGSIQRRPSACEELVRDIFSKQDRKAARALAILVIVVTLCWAPNVIMKIMLSICPGLLPKWSLVLSSWLVLVNSGLNPYLYATGNTKYKRVLRSCLSKRTQHRHIKTEPFRIPSKYLSKQYLAVKLEHNILSNVILKPA
ncbi:muscarinic acetylcholine receptor M3-like [Lineus longissimus]|uniref:muscarinic acetylcholine receptor M3-like n=1 Tax=Lineus longissimus TaxID=88925 RepID=UPI002B4F45C5